MIYLLWNVYNEGQRLTDSMSVAAETVQKSWPFGNVGLTHINVVIEGKYPMHDGPPSDLNMFLIPTASAWICEFLEADEPTKLTRLFELVDEVAQPGDYVLRIDADELLLSLNYERVANCDVGWIKFRRVSDGRVYRQPRLIKWRPGLHIGDRHFAVLDANDEVVASLDKCINPQVVGTGIHIDFPREAVREQAERRYYKWLQEEEGKR